jgi:hypothetical protein
VLRRYRRRWTVAGNAVRGWHSRQFGRMPGEVERSWLLSLTAWRCQPSDLDHGIQSRCFLCADVPETALDPSFVSRMQDEIPCTTIARWTQPGQQSSDGLLDDGCDRIIVVDARDKRCDLGCGSSR